MIKCLYIPGLLLLFCLFTANTFGQSDLSTDTFHVSIHCKSCSYQSVFENWQKKYNLNFFYDQNDSIFKKNRTINFNNSSIGEILDDFFAGTKSSWLYYPPRNIIVMPDGNKSYAGKAQIDKDQRVQIGNALERGKNRTATLSGHIKDGKNNQPLIGAVVYSEEADRGAVTNADGYYTIELPAGKQTIEISSVGYEQGKRDIELISSGNLDVDLFEESIALDEVVVSRKRVDQNVSQAQMSTIELTAKEIVSIPSLMGETDVIKSMTLMPGVQTIGEAATGFNIRGGNVDQNLILVEDIPIFNTSHLFGFFSTIHPGAVSDVTLYKGNIPASYGGRISSVMDIGIKDADMKKLKVEGGIGLINARVTLEVPVIKDKLSVLAAYRSTYSDWILHQIPDVNLRESQAGYYDMLSKIKYRINNKNSLSIFAYKSNDRFNLANTSLYEYGNQLMGIKLNHVVSGKLYFLLSASSSDYALKVSSKKYEGDPSAFKMKSGILQNSAKLNLTYIPYSKQTITAGVEFSHTLLNPGETTPILENSLVVSKTIQQEKGNETGIYVNDNFEINSWLTFNGGIRYSFYNYPGPQAVKEYQSGISRSVETILDTVYYKSNSSIQKYGNLEPRLSLKISAGDNSSVKLGYTRNAQYIQLLSNTAAATPTDVWKLCDTYIKPLLSNQYSVGYFRNFAGNTIETSVEAYYKDIDNLIDYKNGAVVIMNDHIETDIVDGKGKTYGIELMIKKNSGKLTGWLGYTYSRSLKKTVSNFTEDLINRGEYYPASYDKPHDITTTLLYQFTRRWSISGNFIYSTGRPVTLPEYQFDLGDRQMVYFSDRNKYRLPDYNRLDLSITYHGQIKANKRFKSSWTLSVFNVYGRNNPYSVYYTKDQPTAANNYNEYVLYKLSIVNRPIPTLTYNFKF